MMNLRKDVLKWHRRFYKLAQEVATWSKDPSTKCGCVLVRDRRLLSTGYNGLARKIKDAPIRYLDRELKYGLVIHAEQNAIYNAAENGESVKGADVYCTWPPCSLCASALIQVQVRYVICPSFNLVPRRWLKSFALARVILAEAGIKVLHVDELL